MSLEQDLNQNYFEDIKHFNKNSSEYWYGKEMMPLLGYLRWDTFVVKIESAISNLELLGDNVEDHIKKIQYTVKHKTGGSLNKDFILSCYGAFMVVSSCDDRKKEVALGKQYFAFKIKKSKLNIKLTEDSVTSKKNIFDYLEASERLEKISNPILKSALEQQLLQELNYYQNNSKKSDISNQFLKSNQLDKSEKIIKNNQETLKYNDDNRCILTVRAKELGYSNSQIGDGKSLGYFIAKHLSPIDKFQHGKYKVNVYLKNRELDNLIHKFMNEKSNKYKNFQKKLLNN